MGVGVGVQGWGYGWGWGQARVRVGLRVRAQASGWNLRLGFRLGPRSHLGCCSSGWNSLASGPGYLVRVRVRVRVRSLLRVRVRVRVSLVYSLCFSSSFLPGSALAW